MTRIERVERYVRAKRERPSITLPLEDVEALLAVAKSSKKLCVALTEFKERRVGPDATIAWVEAVPPIMKLEDEVSLPNY